MWRRVAQACLFVLAISAAQAAGAQTMPMVMPDTLKVPRQNVLLLKTFAVGAQVYVCKARTDDPNMFEWTFKAPEAELRNDVGETVGRHYAGPTWEGNDGSKVVGEVAQRVDAHNPHDIPWLLLKAKSHEGSGAFSTISYVQRLDTDGGIAPQDGCTQSTVNTERRVDYRATYTFSYAGAQ